MSSTYAAENAIQRQRLFALTGKLTEVDLARELANGWSVATALAHLAFWDRYCLALIEGWERTGLTPSSASADVINEAVRYLSGSIPPRAAVQLAQAAAEAIDRKLEVLTPELAQAIEASGRTRILRRSLHRSEHLDAIEKALAATPDGA